MEVWIESLCAHLVDLVHVVGGDALEELLQVGLGVGRLELLLVKGQHLVHATLVLELEEKEKNKIPKMKFLHNFGTAWH